MIRIFFTGILLFIVNASFSQNNRTTLTDLLDEYTACLNHGRETCDLELASRESMLMKQPNELVAEFFLDIGLARMNSGLWDEKTISYLKQSEAYYVKAGELCASMDVNFRICGLALHTGNLGLADTLSALCLEHIELCNDSTLYSRAWSYRVGHALYSEDIERALLYAQEEERVAIQYKDTVGLGRVYQEKASIYRSLYQEDEALKYTRQSEKLARTFGSEEEHMRSLLELAISYSSNNITDSVRYCTDQIGDYFDDKNPFLRALAGFIRGNAHFGVGDYERAESEYIESMSTMEQLGDMRTVGEIHADLAELYHATSRHRQALQFAQKSLSIAEELKDYGLIIKALSLLGTVAHANGLYDLSFASLQRHKHLNDSLLNAIRLREIAQLENQFDYEKSQLLIEEKQLENDRLLAENRSRRNLVILLILGVVVLIFAGIILYLKIRASRNQAKALSRLRELENVKLNHQLMNKNRELTSKALLIAQKSELLNDLQQELNDLQQSDPAIEDFTELINKLRRGKHLDDNWEQFMREFTQLNPTFTSQLIDRYPDLTKSELRLAALIKMRLESKDISNILNITPDGVKKARYRLRKKMDLDGEDVLETVIERL